MDFPTLIAGLWLAQSVCSSLLGNERFNCSDLLLVNKEMRPSQTTCFSLLVFFLSLQVFRPRTPPEAIALCSRLLEYTPTARLTPLEACAHSFFDELRDPNVKLPNGRDKPALFNFTTQGSPSLLSSCITSCPFQRERKGSWSYRIFRVLILPIQFCFGTEGGCYWIASGRITCI